MRYNKVRIANEFTSRKPPRPWHHPTDHDRAGWRDSDEGSRRIHTRFVRHTLTSARPLIDSARNANGRVTLGLTPVPRHSIWPRLPKPHPLRCRPRSH